MSKISVLILIDHYLPGTRAGGPVRTISNLVEALGDDIDFKIITRDRDLGDSIPYKSVEIARWQSLGKASVLYLRSSDLLPWRLSKRIRATDYEVILLNGIFPPVVLSVLLGRRLGWFAGRSVVVAPRGHLETGALSLKSRKKQLFLSAARALGFYRDVAWLCASEAERQDVQRQLGAQPDSKIRVIPNLPSKSSALSLGRTPCKRKGVLKLVFLSRVSRMKNLEYALESLTDARGSIQFDVYGPVEDETYWSECCAIIDRLPATTAVTHKGSIEPTTVGTILAEYDAFFLPTLGENFGHAILEALSAGCPVLISDRTPWNDINEKGAGWALPLDQPERFREVIQMLIDADDETMSAYRQRARAYAEAYHASSTAVEDMRRFLLDVAASNTP